MIFNNKDFYKKSIEKFGISAQGVHWNSKYTQYKRFEIITKIIKKDIKNSSILDAGCGFGEYYNYLQTIKKVPKKYIGIDREKIMIDIAQKRFPTQEFKVVNILHDPIIETDYTISSGALSLLSYDECEIFIEKCYKASKKGFIFNYLKTLSFKSIKSFEIEQLAQNISLKQIIIKDNYLKNDFTIFMPKY